MPRIQVVKRFRHAHGQDIHPTTFEPGKHEVDETCAEVAFRNGWARPLTEAPAPSTEASAASAPAAVSGRPSDPSGPASASSSPEAAPASPPKTSSKRVGEAG